MLFLLSTGNAVATHLRAGEIIATRLKCSALTYRITITVYIDTESGVHFGGPGEILHFGDSTSVEVPDTQTTLRPDLGANMGMAQFVIDHTYAGPGRYLIRYAEPFRNGSVVNIDDPLSTLFYIETAITIDVGCDNTPRLLVPPIDKACVGAAWYHNPGAYDVDGDSLSFELSVPKMGKGVEVIDYRDPNTKEFYVRGGIDYNTADETHSHAPTFSINPTTGTIIWDAPGMQGEYNIAFLIKEWRRIGNRWILLGYVERDMQIIVEDCNNQRPELQMPADICVDAGTLIDQDIFGYDPDSDSVMINVFSEVLIVSPPAIITPSPAKFQASGPANPAKIHFQWQTDCNDVREQFYQVQVKITDKPRSGGVPLIQFKTWNIKVVGPPPEWNTLQQDLSARSATLVWDKYQCGNAVAMQVWRRIDGVPFTPPQCVTGMPAFLGYTRIAEVPIDQPGYVDNNGGRGLAIGARYCYRLVAVYPGTTLAESYVSKDTCLAPILANAPVVTNVTIDKTSSDQGQVTVKWRSPFDLDKTQFPPPYTYEVYRAEGITGKAKMMKPHPGRLSDSTYADTGINTEALIYNYRILAYDANNNLIDTSSVASSVRLDVHPQVDKIGLVWTADVPWSNQAETYPMHLIYRGAEGATEDQLELIDSVNVNRSGFNYLDSGQYNHTPLENTKVYCYRVMTRGSYGNPKIHAPLLNFSEKICAIPNDTTPPCKPKFGSDIIAQVCDNLPDGGCGVTTYSNTIRWNKPVDLVCGGDVVSYNIYVADQAGGEFTEYAKDIRDTMFVDNSKALTSFARCYKIQAVDRSGNKSGLSEQFCFDNCTHYELPNVFSPNGDGCNDVFSAFGDPDRDIMCEPDSDPSKCAKYVERVDFVVYDRWGKRMYELRDSKERSIYIRWNGIDNDGREVPPGVYYYRAEVHYITVDPEKQTEQLKGWVQLVRGGGQ
jgi:hypothetical protein